ncbi:hypothetical protein Hanom_Chr03g00229151 [Helianthus anomalus]
MVHFIQLNKTNNLSFSFMNVFFKHIYLYRLIICQGITSPILRLRKKGYIQLVVIFNTVELTGV